MIKPLRTYGTSWKYRINFWRPRPVTARHRSWNVNLCANNSRPEVWSFCDRRLIASSALLRCRRNAWSAARPSPAAKCTLVRENPIDSHRRQVAPSAAPSMQPAELIQLFICAKASENRKRTVWRSALKRKPRSLRTYLQQWRFNTHAFFHVAANIQTYTENGRKNLQMARSTIGLRLYSSVFATTHPLKTVLGFCCERTSLNGHRNNELASIA